MSPYADFPKSNRTSMEWGREAIEMQENGSTKNLLQMSDIYYSVRRSVVVVLFGGKKICSQSRANTKHLKIIVHLSRVRGLYRTIRGIKTILLVSSARLTELGPGEKRPVPVHRSAGLPALLHLPGPVEPVVHQRRLAKEGLFLTDEATDLCCISKRNSAFVPTVC